MSSPRSAVIQGMACDLLDEVDGTPGQLLWGGVKEGKRFCGVRCCSVWLPPEQLMCARHWGLVPPLLRQRVFEWAYLPWLAGQALPARGRLAVVAAMVAAMVEVGDLRYPDGCKVVQAARREVGLTD